MQNIKSKILEVLKNSNPRIELESIVLQLSKEGLSKQAIYDLFHDIYQQMNDDKFQDAVGDILDRLWGWCSKDNELLPNEKLNKF